MGTLCTNKSKPTQSKDQSRVIKQSNVALEGSRSTIFSSLSCPIDNLILRETAEKLITEQQFLKANEFQWKSIKIAGVSGLLHGTCDWAANSQTINGRGLIYKPGKSTQFIIIGTFKNGNVSKGQKYYKIFGNGAYYHGQISKALVSEGKGQLVYNNEDKEVYTGQFLGGIPHGLGQLKCEKKNFKGTFNLGEKQKGKQTGKYGQYNGQFKNNKRDGYGTLLEKSGRKYVGSFKANQMHGKGILYDKDKKVIHDGTWQKDKKVK